MEPGKILKKLFGSKSQRDIKAILPLLHNILEEYEKVVLLDNDQLRAKTVEIKEQIRNHVREDEDRIEQLNEVDIEGVDAMASAVDVKLPMREDAVQDLSLIHI